MAAVYGSAKTETAGRLEHQGQQEGTRGCWAGGEQAARWHLQPVLDNTGQIARRGGGELREKSDEEETCRGWRGEQAGLPGREEEKPARSSSNC
ncbi:Protein of unknown function [Pyronema omphalodes CBS 100304]|uniref:Uncharacterized protein n=1 Tax=Pyronema omphalodes (strain CBS 100304) TaxID=1076935 RepID=U4L841_PYROM|nr:Protein of unknown function [Pyronema omphalodes CBS 100304]